MDERVDLRIDQFEKKFDEKTKVLDDIFASLFQRQNEIERLSELKHDATLKLIDHKNSHLKGTNEKSTKNSRKAIENKIEDSDQQIETGINGINQRLNSLEEVLIREKERLDKLQQMSGMTIDEIELKMEDRDRNINDKIGALEEKLEQLTAVIESVQEKMYDFEINKKNNLIFYGIPQEERETPQKLTAKINELVKIKMRIQREMSLSNVSRMYTGSDVLGCRPVLVTFEDFKDKEDVLKASKLFKKSVISVSEDLSKRTREARQQLRKFMKKVKKNRPDKHCFVQYDKLFIDGRVFMYSEKAGRVIEQKNSKENEKRTRMKSCPPLSRSMTTPSPGSLKSNSKISERVTELERLMQEQSNMISTQKNTIKEQENVITCQKSMIGRLSEDRIADSDYETYETYTTYSDTDDNHSPTRKSVHYSRNLKPRIERMNSCSTLSNYHMADTNMEEDQDEV